MTITFSPAAGRPVEVAGAADEPTTGAADPTEADPADDASPGRRALVAEIVAGSGTIAMHQRCAVGRRLLRQGVSMAHLQALWILDEHGGALPVSRLAEFLGIAVPNATGLVARMEQRGLVERVRPSGDRRVVMVRPTGLGRETTDEIDGWRGELMASILDRLDMGQLQGIVRAMRDIRNSYAAEAGTAGQASRHASHPVSRTATPCPPERPAPEKEVTHP